MSDPRCVMLDYDEEEIDPIDDAITLKGWEGDETEWLRRTPAREAAPDLLDACEAMLNRLDYLRNLWGDEGVTRTLCDQVRAAVARAKGETP